MSISSPVWEKISFLDVTVGGKTTHFGVFGYTGSNPSVGYTFAPDRLGYNDTKLNTGVLHSLTFVLILYPVGKSPFSKLANNHVHKIYLQPLVFQDYHSSLVCVALATTELAQFSCPFSPLLQPFAPSLPGSFPWPSSVLLVTMCAMNLREEGRNMAMLTGLHLAHWRPC